MCTQFTGFTGTKVQVLTQLLQEELVGRRMWSEDFDLEIELQVLSLLALLAQKYTY